MHCLSQQLFSPLSLLSRQFLTAESNVRHHRWISCWSGKKGDNSIFICNNAIITSKVLQVAHRFIIGSGGGEGRGALARIQTKWHHQATMKIIAVNIIGGWGRWPLCLPLSVGAPKTYLSFRSDASTNKNLSNRAYLSCYVDVIFFAHLQ